MINLEPIAKSVQKRLFEKMRALGKEASYSDDPTGALTQADMMSRSTFIKMASGQKKPVILMGGELKRFGIEGGGIRGGYDEIYGSRDNNINSDKRPMPGIKSIDVTFRGGLKSHREATISWTCWSFEDINRLSDHFLSFGKTVLLEWGWIFNKQSLTNLPTFINSSGKIKGTAYTDYIKEILSAGGDMDMMVGQIKNFEYTTRADGGFDCQTILGSVGVSIISNNIPNDTMLRGSKTLDISSQDSNRNLEKKLKKLKNNKDLIAYDLNVSLKTFLSNFKTYLKEQINKDENTKNAVNLGQSGDQGQFSAINFVKDKFIVKGFMYEDTKTFLDGGVHQAWVRWGWFEDNILSKFTSMTARSTDGKENQIVSEFRSIDNDVKTNEKTSVKIRSSKYLETVNPWTYILPGKFNPVEKLQEINIAGEKVKLEGDTKELLMLASLANNFPHFSPGSIPKKGPEGQEIKQNSKGDYYYFINGKDNSDGSKVIKKTEKKNFGYIRNMLINVNTIQSAFGTSDNMTTYGADVDTSEALSIDEAMKSLFDKLNAPLDYWTFALEQDPILPSRVRIIDEQMTAVDFTKPINTQRSVYGLDTLLKHGIFYFPVWRHDSIVKSQNVVTKVNNAMALMVMYGSNLDQLKFPNGASSSGDSQGLIVGGLNNGNTDVNKAGLDFAFKNFSDIGNENGYANQNLEINGSKDGVLDFLKTNIQKIKDYYAAREKNTNKLKATGVTIPKTTWDESKPLPLLSYLDAKQQIELLEEAPEYRKKELEGLYGSKYEYESNGYYKMKEDLIKAIEYFSREHSVTDDNEGELGKSMLLPLEMEMVVDGIGGIYPGNSFHSTYLPKNYRDKTVFQMFDVNHTVDSSGWATSISGKMRSTLSQVFPGFMSKNDVIQDLINNFKNKEKDDINQAAANAKWEKKMQAKMGGKDDWKLNPGGKWVDNETGEGVLIFDGDDTTGLTWVPE